MARTAATLVALLVFVPLAGCTAMVGDLGRAEPGPFQSDVLPAKGVVRDSEGKLKAAAIVVTDTERAMRDRIWRFLGAPHSAGWFGDVMVQLQAASAPKKPAKVDRYYGWLHGDDLASVAARYNRLAADIDDDLTTLPDTLAAICAVQQLDRERGLAANQLDLEATLNAGAAARLAENRDLAGRFALGLRNRYDNYSYALDHLLVEAPDPAARGIDSQLSTLLISVEAAGRADYCPPSRAVTVTVPAPAPAGGPKSRYAPVG